VVSTSFGSVAEEVETCLVRLTLPRFVRLITHGRRPLRLILPYIWGADLQFYNDGSGGYLVQLGFGRCENNGSIQCGGGWVSGKDMLGWTSSDHSNGYIVPATWWNQGLGAGVVQDTDIYELAIVAISGPRWEFAVRDVSSNSAWKYGYTTNDWPYSLGGNLAWWG
jgi:hypothetical protein